MRLRCPLRTNKQTFSIRCWPRCLSLFAIKKFPVPIAGNSFKDVSGFNGFVQAGRGVSTEIPCIFPRIREFRQRRRVRCCLSAQPPSLVFSRSLPALSKQSGRSPEMHHQMAVVFSDPTRELHVSRGLSLQATFGGHTYRGADGPDDQLSIMITEPSGLHQPDGMLTQVREDCGAGMHMVNGVCVTTPARHQVRRCLVWGAGHVCRKWD